ncbi:MAG: 4-vinyl reductase [Anaerolineales bacterium]|nr:4-vinyl reductase [Anaerolineales bacterium]MDW8279274.1 4-vinyl reductase [Anaerolineales bacterium]
MKEPCAQLLPLRFFRQFLETLTDNVGKEALLSILAKAKLPADLVEPQTVSRYNCAAAAETYANIQKAMRIYYGRGARGALNRIGRLLWPRLLETASLSEKAQAQVIRTLPPSMRAKPTLELLARFLREHPEGVTVHTLDLDLLLVDRAGAVTTGQKEVYPICYVTIGLAQEALFWASGREHDVEERACRAAGAAQCEFKVTMAK